MSVKARAIAVAVAAVGLAGCGRKPPLPPGLDRIAPGAAIDDLARAAPSFHALGAERSVLVSDDGYLCFDGSGRALALGGGLMTLVYRRSAGDPARMRACFDETLRRPPVGWTLLAAYACASPAPVSETRREAFFAIDGRWGARAVDTSSRRQAPRVEVAFFADTDVRADARHAADESCSPLSDGDR